MASNYDDKKHQKYIQTENHLKKLSAAIDYIRSATVDNEKAFFINHFVELLSLMNEVIRISEEAQARDKKRFISGVMRFLRHQDEKYYLILELLDRMMYHIPDKVNATTARHTIQTLITRFLHPNHAHVYRLAAFEVLLRFVYQFTARDVEQLLLDAIPKAATTSSSNTRSLSSDGGISRPASVSSSQWHAPITELIDREDVSPSEQEIAQFLDKIFHVSVTGLPAWIGSRGKITFTLSHDALLEQFHFWQRLIFRQLLSVLIGSKVLSTRGKIDDFPLHSRSCRFHTPPLAVQMSIDAWILETMKRNLIDEFWRSESKTFVTLLFGQRFQREIARTVKGLTFMSQTITFYRILLSLEQGERPYCLSSIVMPSDVTEHRDYYVQLFTDHVANVFGLMGGGEQTVAMQDAQFQVARDAWELLLSILKTSHAEVLCDNIRRHCYRLSDLYSPQTRIPVYVNTTPLYVDALYSSHFRAPNWRDENMHKDFASKLYVWLTDGYTACRPAAPPTLEAALKMQNYDVYQNFAAEELIGVVSTDMQIKLCQVWRRLLFSALNVYCLFLNASHGDDAMPLQLTQLIEQQENDIGAVVGTDKMLWVAESYLGLPYLQLNTLSDVKVLMKILLSLMPLVTVATLAPDLHTIVTSACADVVLFGVGNCIVRKRLLQEKVSHTISGEAKGNYKLTMKARAKLEEQELSSPLSALPVNVIFALVSSHLTSIAMDVRPCFKVSKMLAIDAMCCAVTCRALNPLSGDALESCLSLIYNALIGSDLKMYAVVVHALEIVFTLHISNILQFLEPLWSAIDSTLKYYGKRGNHVPTACAYSSHFPTYSSPTITSIIEGRSSSRVVSCCNTMMSSMIGCIYCHPSAVGAPPLPAGSLPSNHRLHNLQVMFHSGRQGHKFASLIIPMFNCAVKYIKHGTKTELRVLLLRTVVVLFIHEYHFGIAEAHENQSLCDEWIKQLCAYLADENHSLKLAALECFAGMSQVLCHANQKRNIPQIIYGSFISVLKESMTQLIKLCVEQLRSSSDERQCRIKERTVVVRSVLACIKRLAPALKHHKLYADMEIQSSRASIFEFDLAREIEALPGIWVDVAKRGGYSAKELLDVAEEDECIQAIGDYALECKAHFSRFGHISGEVCVPTLDAKMYIPGDDEHVVHLLHNNCIISLYPSATSRLTLVIRDKLGISTWRVEDVPEYKKRETVRTSQIAHSSTVDDAKIMHVADNDTNVVSSERFEIPSPVSDVDTRPKSNNENRKHVTYSQLSDMLQQIMNDADMCDRLEKYLNSVHAEDSWIFLMSLKQFELTLAACIENPTDDPDLRIAELKQLYFQHFMMECDQPLNVSGSVSVRVVTAFEQLMLLAPDDEVSLLATLKQLESGIADAKNEILSMLVQDKLLGFFKSMGRYGDLLLDLEMVSAENRRISKDLVWDVKCDQSESIEQQWYNKRYTILVLLQELHLIPQPHVEDETDDWAFDDRIRQKQFQQTLRHIDGLPTREQFKIGVLYVQQGQTTQREILSNTDGSDAYMKFVENLGTNIDLSTHEGFDGLMDRSEHLTDGRHFPYYSDDEIEVFFHVATSMPTVPDDPQQIAKKRHIGNDFVHIVFNEDLREYNPNVITSEFGDVVIVVSPLDNMPLYYAISVLCKADLALGPLSHGMIVSQAFLPILLRQTAVRANRQINLTRRKAYMLPHAVREQAFIDLGQTYGVPFSHELFLHLALGS